MTSSVTLVAKYRRNTYYGTYKTLSYPLPFVSRSSHGTVPKFGLASFSSWPVQLSSRTTDAFQYTFRSFCSDS